MSGKLAYTVEDDTHVYELNELISLYTAAA